MGDIILSCDAISIAFTLNHQVDRGVQFLKVGRIDIDGNGLVVVQNDVLYLAYTEIVGV